MPVLRGAVEGFLCVVPLVFFTDTASRSGRLHPPWQCRRHGTLRSIVESCVLLPGWARHVQELLDAGIDVISAVNIQHQTGGNLAEILSRLSSMLRSRLKLRACKALHWRSSCMRATPAGAWARSSAGR